MWKLVETESCLGDHSKINTDTEVFSVQRVVKYYKLNLTYKGMSGVPTGRLSARHVRQCREQCQEQCR